MIRPNAVCVAVEAVVAMAVITHQTYPPATPLVAMVGLFVGLIGIVLFNEQIESEPNQVQARANRACCSVNSASASCYPTKIIINAPSASRYVGFDR